MEPAYVTRHSNLHTNLNLCVQSEDPFKSTKMIGWKSAWNLKKVESNFPTWRLSNFLRVRNDVNTQWSITEVTDCNGSWVLGDIIYELLQFWRWHFFKNHIFYEKKTMDGYQIPGSGIVWKGSYLFNFLRNSELSGTKPTDFYVIESNYSNLANHTLLHKHS